MNLLQTIERIHSAAANNPNVNTIIEEGNIFQLNEDNYEVRYSAFCATQLTHTFDEDMFHFNFTLYYVDRLTADQKNKNEVQSTAVNVLTNIYKDLQSDYRLSISASDITTFTQKFTAECAGAFMNVEIITTQNNMC